MDTGADLPEKHLTNGRGKYHGEIFQIRAFNLVGDLSSFLPVFWQAWLFIHGVDKSSYCKITIKGKEWEVQEIEALLYWYLHDENSNISIALHDNEIVGFVIYNKVLESVKAIRMLYTVPGHKGTGIGMKLISSIEGLSTLIFQTKKTIEPESLFSVTRGRQIKLSETDEMITWSMNLER
jgi:GNAT superfamily N-acetyltransferase